MSGAHRRWLVGSGGGLLVLGLAIGSPALIVLAAAWLAVLVLARAEARRVAAGLHAAREAPASGFEHEAVRVALVLENRSRRPATLVRLEDVFGASLADTRALLEPGPLPGRRRRRYEYRGDCSRGWGIHTLGPITLHAADALGLWPQRRALLTFAPIAVYPRLIDVAWIAPGGVRATSTPHAAAAPRPGDGALFLGVREYRAGDDTRRIHWPATARRGTPIVKEMETELLPYLTVAVDLDRTHRAGTGRRSTAEAIVRASASLLWSGARRGFVLQMVGADASPLHLPPGSGSVHLAEGLHRLLQVRQAGALGLLDLLEQCVAALPAGSSLAVTSGTVWLDDARLEALLHALRARRVGAAFVLVSADTFAPFSRLAAHPERVRERETALLARLRAWGASAVVVHAGEDVGAVLRRAGAA